MARRIDETEANRRIGQFGYVIKSFNGWSQPGELVCVGCKKTVTIAPNRIRKSCKCGWNEQSLCQDDQSDCIANGNSFDPVALIDDLQGQIEREKIDILDQIRFLDGDPNSTNSTTVARNRLARRFQDLTDYGEDFALLRDKFTYLGRRQERDRSESLVKTFQWLNSREGRKWAGEYAQKMNLAAQIVELEWSELIPFEDSKYDKPFLSPEGELRDMEQEKLDAQQL